MSATSVYLADRLELLREIESIAADFASIEVQTGVTFDDEWQRLHRVRARVLAQVRALPINETVQ